MNPAAIVEEKEWIQQYQEAHDPGALEKLTHRYLPLLTILAKRTARRIHRVEADDLVQVGWIGLRKAIEEYDPAKGASPMTFFRRRILGRMGHWVRDTLPLIRPMRLRDQSYAPPFVVWSLSTETEDDHTLADIFGEIDAGYARAESRIDLARYLSKLPRLKRQAMALVIAGYTQTEAAKRVGYSQKHISRIFHQTLESAG